MMLRLDLNISLLTYWLEIRCQDSFRGVAERVETCSQLAVGFLIALAADDVPIGFEIASARLGSWRWGGDVSRREFNGLVFHCG
jgi:hypothetical protein